MELHKLAGFLRCPDVLKQPDSRDLICPENRLFKTPELWNFEYPMTGYWIVCMPDDSDKAWGMLFESEAWPLPFRISFSGPIAQCPTEAL